MFVFPRCSEDKGQRDKTMTRWHEKTTFSLDLWRPPVIRQRMATKPSFFSLLSTAYQGDTPAGAADSLDDALRALGLSLAARDADGYAPLRSDLVPTLWAFSPALAYLRKREETSWDAALDALLVEWLDRRLTLPRLSQALDDLEAQLDAAAGRVGGSPALDEAGRTRASLELVRRMASFGYGLPRDEDDPPLRWQLRIVRPASPAEEDRERR